MNRGGIRTLRCPLSKSILNGGGSVTASGAGNVAPLMARHGLATRGGHGDVRDLLGRPLCRVSALGGPFRERPCGCVPAVHVLPGRPLRLVAALGGPFRERPCECVLITALVSSSASSPLALPACGCSTGRTAVESGSEKLPLPALPPRPFALTLMTPKVRLSGRVRTTAGLAPRRQGLLQTRPLSSPPPLFLAVGPVSSSRKGRKGLVIIAMPRSQSPSPAIFVRWPPLRPSAVSCPGLSSTKS